MSAVMQRERVHWGHSDLMQLRDDAAAGMSLGQMAMAQGPRVYAVDCDLALWALVGRTIPQACNYLNGVRA